MTEDNFKVLKTEGYWVCERCDKTSEDEHTSDVYCPCPRGFCDAELKGDVYTVLKLNTDED